jgi:AbrB family looped-hinge helix DNA binding protein
MGMVMAMAEKTKIDKQGRVLIPKELREKIGLTGEVEILEVDRGIFLRPLEKSWDDLFKTKLKVDWQRAMTVSLEDYSIDDLIFE